METNRLYSKVFLWMFVGLLISFVTGYYVSTQEAILLNLYNKGIIFAIWIAELVIAVVLSACFHKLSTNVARILFGVYSLFTGFTLSSIFVVYKIDSIILVFGETALLFAIFAFLGAKSKIDLSKFGTFLIMALLGMVIAGIVNIFLRNTMLDFILNVVGLLVFLGYIAYDMQKVKVLAESMSEEEEDKVAIYGAFELYLDFINLFLKLIQLFGKEKD